jgi:hypothetical protein
MPRREEIYARIRDFLQVAVPDWDISVGTLESKAVEAFAVELEAVTLDSVLNDYHLDPDKKAGQELDEFMSLFGFFRLAGQRATGSVTLSRGTVAPQDYVIPQGTQVIAPSSVESQGVYFQTVTSASLAAGQTSVEVPVECLEAGTFGNVAAGVVTTLGTTLGGVSQVVNHSPFTGGTDPESDADFRARWRQTSNRNYSGTEGQFIALALQERAAKRALVIGPVSTYKEQLALGAPGTVTSQNNDSKFTYPPGGEFFGFSVGQAGEVLGIRAPAGVPGGNDYSMSTAVPPVVTLNNRTLFPNGAVAELEQQYCAKCSRNNPATGVLDKIDVFVSGDDPKEAIEQLVMSRSTSVQWTAGQLDRTQWVRDDGVSNPATGNFLMQLFKTPLTSIPDRITVGTVTYTKEVDYWLIRDLSTNRFSARARDGIEWRGSTPGTGPTATLSAGGTIAVGSRAYVVTFVIASNPDGTGVQFETAPGPASNAVNPNGSQQVSLTNIPLGPAGTKQRIIYRSKAGNGTAGPFFKVGTISNNTVTTFTDNNQDAALTTGVTSDVPADGAPVTMDYFYNSLIERIDAQLGLVRLVGTDTLAHRGRYLGLRFNFAVIIKPEASATVAQADIQAALQNWLNAKDFKDNVQIADVIEVVSGIDAVDNVRLTTSGEASPTEVQTLTFTGMAGGNTFVLVVGGKTTGSISYSATGATLASNIQTAIEALSNVHVGDVAVSSPSAGVVTVTFQANGTTGLNNWGYRDIPDITVASTSNGSVAVVETTKGRGYGIEQIAENGQTIVARYTSDLYLESDQIPLMSDVVLLLRARNNF